MTTRKTAAKTKKVFDWEKYLEENPHLTILNKDRARQKKLIEGSYVSHEEQQRILAENKDDNSLKLLLLQFFRDALHLSGYESVEYSPIGPAAVDYSGVVCKIRWKDGVTTSGIGDAHYDNCTSFTKYYLGPMAENRSFIRAVKLYLNIPILGYDEVGNTPSDDAPQGVSGGVQRSGAGMTPVTGPQGTLERVVKEKLGISTFDQFKAHLSTQCKNNPKTAWIQPDEYETMAGIKSYSDFDSKKCLQLIGYIKKQEDQ